MNHSNASRSTRSDGGGKSRRRVRRLVFAASALLVVLGAAAPAIANDDQVPAARGPIANGYAGWSYGRTAYGNRWNVGRSFHRKVYERRSPWQRAYDRGQNRGYGDGRHQGYDDAFYGRVFCAEPIHRLRRRSRPYHQGYYAAFADAYAVGYEQGLRERRCW